MFTRLRKTAYILSHREEKALPHFTPEVEFVQHTTPQYSRISKWLASCLAFIAFLFFIRIGINPAVHWLEKATGRPEVSLTAVGLVGALMWFALDRVTNAVRDAIQKHFGIALTPHLGHRLEETYRILRGQTPIADTGTKKFTVKKDESGQTTVTPQQKTKAWMQVFVSLIVLITGILVLTSPNFAFHQNFDESTKKWASGWVGAVIGYWLS